MESYYTGTCSIYFCFYFVISSPIRNGIKRRFITVVPVSVEGFIATYLPFGKVKTSVFKFRAMVA